MLTFFRINTLLHVITILVLLLLIKIPFAGDKLPILLPELEWMLVGEKLHAGQHLYSEIWTNIGPLSAIVYWGLDFAFGRSQFAYEMFALFLTFLQALYFVYVSNSRHSFIEKNYIHGLMYILLMNFSFDLSKLSPALLATTFLLFAYSKILKQIESRDGVSDEVFEIGLYIGIASLFHQPTLIFILWAILVSVFFSNINLRKLFLLFLGFLLPIMAVGLFFYFNNAFDEFKYNWIESTFRIKQYHLEDLKSTLIVITVPAIVAVLGFFKMVRINRYNNYQQRTQQIMLLWAVFALVALILSPNIAPMQFILIVPCFAFFVSGYFYHVKGMALPEFLFTVFLMVILLVQYQGVTPVAGKGYTQLAEMRIDPQPLPELMKGQRMLVIGDRIDEYVYGQPATCYLNWDLSKIDLANPDSYESVINIFDNFKKDPPTIIIDKKNVIEKIFQRIPELAKDYSKTKEKGIYQHR